MYVHHVRTTSDPIKPVTHSPTPTAKMFPFMTANSEWQAAYRLAVASLTEQRFEQSGLSV